MQTIIGSGGTIGIPLARELKQYTDDIRLVSRHPKKVNATDTLFAMDATNLTDIDRAIAGSEVVYVTIGFEYSLKIWRKVWPPFMTAVIDACKAHQAKLVFFDNVYMYSKESMPHMTEESPLDPPSKKGAVRKALQEMIVREVEQKQLEALIARSADFYGPESDKSFMAETIAKNYLKGKKAQAFGDLNKFHTFTFTPDAAKATAILGNSPDAYSQVWHLPTTKERLTNKQWIEMIAGEIDVQPRITVIPTWMFSLLGVFIPMLKELPEMMYQYKMDYIFDSSKFEKRFGIAATAPKDGIKMMIDYLKANIKK